MSTLTTRLKRILVAVDLAMEHRFVSREFSNSTKEAIRRGIWLASENSCELCFLYVLPQRAERLSYDRYMVLTDDDDYKTVCDDANEVLEEIVKPATDQGVKAGCKVVLGTHWVEVIREVIHGDYDLVVAGTRKKGAFQRMLFGHTGLKLLRKCPCPVWVAKPQPDEQIASILVAHDLTDVGRAALEFGCWFASKHGAALHVLHATDHAGLDTAEEMFTEAEAKKKIQDQLSEIKLSYASEHLYVVNEPAAEAILSHVEQIGIQLVVMGTIARQGIKGKIVGNTAEKLLPFLPCSVLAVKPADFKTPIS